MATTLTVNNNTTFAGVIGGTPASTAAFTLNGLGTIDFGATNTFVNPVTVNMAGASLTGLGGAFGTVILGANNALGVTGAVSLTGGILQTSVATGVTIPNPITVNTATFTFGGPPSSTFGSNPLTFTGTVTLTGTDTLIIPSATQTTTFAGPMTSTGTLTLAGLGTLSLTANNTNSGAVTIAGGSIILSGPTAAFSSLTNANGITIDTGGILKIDNSGPAANNNTNRIADVTSVTLNGGTLQFLGNNSLATSETMGVLTIANGQSNIALTTGASTTKLTFASLARATGSSGTVVFSINNPAANQLGTSQNQILFTTAPTLSSGIIPSATLLGNNGLEPATYTATTGITNYSNSLVSPQLSYKLSVATLTGTGADNLRLSTSDAISAPGNTTINSLTLVGGTTLTINAGSTLTIASGSVLMTGTSGGSPQIVGGGTLILGSAANPDGIVTVQQGLTATIAVTGFTTSNLTIGGGGALVLPLANANITSTASGAIALVGGIGGINGNIVPTTLTIGSPLSLGNATLKLISGTFLTTIGTSATLPNGLVLTNPLSFFNSNVTLGAPTFPITFNGAVTFAGASELLTIPSGVTITMSGVITGSSSLILNPVLAGATQGTGTLVLSGSSVGTYLGITNIAAGVLSDQSAGGLGSGSEGTVVSNGATLQVMGGISSGEGLAVSGTGAAGTTGAVESVPGGTSLNTLSTTITLLGDTTISTDAGQLSISGVISGAGALTKVGSGVLSLSGANTYTGVTNINAGILEANAASALGTLASGVFVGTVNTSATLQLNPAGNTTYTAKPVTIAGPGIGLNPAGSGNFLLNRGALNNQASTNVWTGNITLNGVGSLTNPADTTIGVAVGGLTVTGSIGQIAPNSLDVVGTGSLTLSAQNSFSGNLTIDSGTVTLSNTNVYTGTTTIGGTSSKLTLSTFGTAMSTSGITVNPTTTLAIDDSVVSISNRFGGTTNKPNLSLNGANFTLTGSNVPGVLSTETLGNLNLVGGNSVITQTSGAGLNAAMILNVSGTLARATGATANFVTANTTNNTPLGSPTNQILIAGFTNDPTSAELVNGIIPYAVTNSLSAAPTDLTTYGTAGITAYASGLGTPAGQAYANTLETASPTSNVRLTASDSLSLSRTVNAILFANPITISIAGGTTLTVGSGQILANTTGSGTTVITGGSLSLGSSEGVIYTNGGTTTTWDTPITGTNGLTLAGTGTITFGGTNNYTGQTALNGTSVTITSNTVFGTGNLVLTAGTITPASAVVLANPIVMNNGAVTFAGTPSITLTGGAQVTGLFNLITSNTTGGVTFAAPIVDGTAPGSISFSGSGALLLAAANTYTGGTTLNVTNALISSNNAAFGPGPLNIAGGSLATGGGTVLGQSVTGITSITLLTGGSGYTAAPTVTIMGGGGSGATATASINSSGVVTGITLTNPGTGYTSAPTVVLGGPGTGATVGASIGAALANNVYLTGNVTFAGSAPLTFTQPVTLDSTAAAVALTVFNSTTFLMPITELGIAHSLSLAGPGTVTLSSAGNSYSGGTTLATGTLGSAGTLAFPGSVLPTTPLGTGLLTLNSGVLQPTAPITLANLVSINASGVSSPLTLTGGNITFTSPVTLLGNSILNVLNTTVVAAPITGAFSLTQEALAPTGIGTGTLQLTAANTYTGATTVLGGTLLLNDLGSVLSSTSFTVNQGGTLTLDNTVINLPSSGTGALSGRLNNAAGVTLNGGTFNFVGNPTLVSGQAMGNLTLAGGSSTISSSNGSGGTLLTFAGLTRALNTGTVNFVAPSGSAPIGSVSATGAPINEIVFAAQATATATLNSGVVTTGSGVVTTNGSGYSASSPPSVTFSGGGGSGATATATVSAAGAVTAITVNNVGSGYTSAPTVAIVAPPKPTNASATAVVSGGKVTGFTNLNGGQNYTAPVTITFGGPGTGATATVSANQIVNGVIQSITITNGGSGYTSAPTVVIPAPPPFIQATATVKFTANVVLSYAVTGAGSGYSATNLPTVTISGGGGTGATATVAVNSSGAVTAITPSPAAPASSLGLGSGYVAVPSVTVAAPALPGQVTVNTTINTPSNILPYAIVTGPTGSVDFATNVNGGVAAFTGYTTGLAAAEAAAQAAMTANPGSTGITDLVVEQSGNDTTSVTPAGLGIAALLINSGGPTSISLAGTLTLTAGAILVTGGSQVSISGGAISIPPVGSSTAGELVLNTQPGSTATVISPIVAAGLQATASATLATTTGQIFSIQVTNGGYGYVTPPTVTITSADGVGGGASATAVLNSSGNVIGFTNVVPGAGFDEPPLVSFTAPPLSPATVGGPGGVLIANGQLQSVTVSFGGAGYQNPPPVFISAPPAGGTQATATATIVNGTITTINITNAGMGYTSAPNVSVPGPDQQATAVATVTNGGISSLTITDPGTGYVFAPNITISGGGGTGATATAVVSNGQVTGYNLTNPGVGYTSAPTVTIDPSLLQATAGAATTITNSQVTSVTIINGGSGYSASSLPTVTFVGGNPTTVATGKAVVSNGTVIGVTITNAGAGYTSPPTVVIGPSPIPTTGLTVTGGGSLTLPNANTTLTGPSNIEGGTVVLGAGAAFGSSGLLTITAGTISATAPVTITNPLSFNNSQVAFAGSNPITFSTGAVTVQGTATAPATAMLTSSVVTTFNGVIGGASGNLTLASGTGSATNPGTFVIAGANTSYGGLTTIINQAKVILTNGSALGTNTAGQGTVLSSGSSIQILGTSAGLTFTEALTMSGAGLTGAGALENMTGNATWAGAITLLPGPGGALNSTIGVDAGTLTISQPISGVTDLNKVGAANLVLSGANTYTGQTNVTQGVLNVATNAAALGSVLGGTTVSTGAVLNLSVTVNPELLTLNGTGSVSGNGANAFTGALDVTTSATWSGNIVVNQGASIGGNSPLTVTGNISGVDLTKTGTSSLTLNANNTFTGALNLLAGTITLANASVNTGPTTIGNGTTLTVNAAGTLLKTSAINVYGGTLALNDTTGNFNLGNRLSTTAPLTFFTGGALTVTANDLSTATPALNIISGTTEAVGPIVLAGGNAQMTLTSSTVQGSTLTLASASLTRSPGASLNFIGVNAAIGSPFNQITFQTAPTLTNGILPYGVISLSSATAPGDFPTYSINGGIAPYANYLTSLVGANATSNVKLSVSTFLASGLGNLTINSLVLVSDTNLALGGTNLTIASGGILATGTGTNAIVGNAGSSLNFGSAEGIISAANLVINANISNSAGAPGITAYGSGFLTLPNASTYTGNTWLDGGTLTVSYEPTVAPTTSPGALGLPNNPLIISGGTFQSGNSLTLPNPVTLGNNANFTVGNTVNAPLSFGGAVTLQGSNQITISSTGGTTFLSGFTQNAVTATNPAASLTLAGAGTVDLPVASNYTGGATIGTGTTGPVLMLGGTNPLGPGVINIVAGTLIAGAPPTIGSPLAGGGTTLTNNVLLGGNFSLSGAAPLTFNGTATLTAGVTLTANGTTTFANGIGEFGGSRAIALDGVGTLVLANPTSTFSGGITVEGGTGVNSGSYGNSVTLSLSGSTTLSNGVLVSGPLGIGTVIFDNGVLNASAPLTLANQLTLNLNVGGQPLVTTGSPITFTGTTTTSGVDVLYVNNTTTFAGPIGSSGGLTMSGTGNLVLTAANTYTGATNVTSGTLTLSGNGTALSSSGFTVNQGGTLTLDNTGTNLAEGNGGSTGRIGNGTALTLNGGTFNFLGNATTTSTQNIGTLTLGASGQATISSTNGAGGSMLFFSTLSRAANGGTVNFVAPAGASPLGSLTGNTIQIGPIAGTISGENTKINQGVSNILPFGTVTSPNGQQDFATNLGGGFIGAFSAYTVGLSPFLTGTEVVELAASDTTSVTAQGLQVGALVLTSGTAMTLGLNGTLSILTGAILTTNGTTATITGGGITPGTPAAPTGELILSTNTGSSLTLDSPLNLTPGSTATATATIANGSGSLASITLTAPGSGYVTPPLVTITGGGPNASGATANATINSAGQVTGLVFTGYVPSASLSTSGITIPNGVTVTAGGSGYTSAPTVTFSGGGGSGAQATATITGGQVSAITVTSPGGGYTSAPTVQINGGGGKGATATAIILTGGTGYTQAPTVQIAPPDVQAAAVAQLVVLPDGTLSGALQEIDLTAGGQGSGYRFPTVPVTIEGNGTGATAVANVNTTTGQVTGIVLTNPGTGYTSPPTITIAPPVQTAGATATFNAQTGTVTGFANVVTGEGYLAPPTVTITPSDNGFDGGATAIATVSNGQVSVALTGPISQISTSGVAAVTIGTGGAGYSSTSPPNVGISPSDGNGSGATAVAVVNASTGAVTAIIVTNPGSGYDAAPVITIDPPPLGVSGVQATATATIDTGGSGYVNTPNVTLVGGGGTFTSATATLVGGVVTAITVVGATGYTSPPTVKIDSPAPPGTLAVATAFLMLGGAGYTAPPIISISPPTAPATIPVGTATFNPANGTINPITNFTGGAGYTSPPAVTITSVNANGTGASATAVLGTGASAGVVVAINLTSAGSGYTANPIVTIAPPFSTATGAAVPNAGQINANGITTTNPGSGYTITPTVTISPPTTTGGTQATAVAVVTNQQVQVQLTNGGSGYTSPPTITVTPPPAFQATGQAIVGVDGTISAINLISEGAGYTSAPTILIEGANGTFDTPATATAVVTSFGFTGLNGGSGYTSPPTITFSGGGASTQAQAVPIMSGGTVIGINVTVAGTGYTSAPTVTFAPAPTGGTTATVSTIFGTTQVTGITIGSSGGSGYTTPPTVIIAPPQIGLTISGGGTVTLPNPNDNVIGPTNVNGGTLILGSPSALGQGTLRLTAATIESTIPISLTNPITMNNSQLTFAGNNPITIGAPISQASFSGQITNDQVDNLKVTYGGYGYSLPPTVSIGNNGGSGSGATGVATIENGVITGLVLTNAGSGYNRNPAFNVTTPNSVVTLTGNVSITSNNVGGVLFYGSINGAGNLTTNGTTPIVLNPTVGTSGADERRHEHLYGGHHCRLGDPASRVVDRPGRLRGLRGDARRQRGHARGARQRCRQQRLEPVRVHHRRTDRAERQRHQQQRRARVPLQHRPGGEQLVHLQPARLRHLVGCHHLANRQRTDRDRCRRRYAGRFGRHLGHERPDQDRRRLARAVRDEHLHGPDQRRGRQRERPDRRGAGDNRRRNDGDRRGEPGAEQCRCLRWRGAHPGRQR